MILGEGVNVVVSAPGIPNFTIAPPASSVVVLPVAGPRGPAGSGGGGSGGGWVIDEAPLESPNAVLTTFTTPVSYTAGTLRVYLNGLREHHATEVSPTTFAFEDAPKEVDSIRLDFLPTP